MNKLYVSGLLVLLSPLLSVPNAIAQFEEGDNDTRIEKYEDLTETEAESDSPTPTSETNTEMMETNSEVQEPNTRAEEKLEEYHSNDSDSYDVGDTEQ